MKTSSKLASVFGVLMLLLGVFYAQRESMRSSQQGVDLIKSVKAM